MKTLFMALIAIASLAQASTQRADITGEWAITVVAPNGNTRGFTVSVPKEGDTVAVVAPNNERRGGSITLDGRVVTITFLLDNPGGVPVRVKMTGALDGDTMTGKAEFGDLGTADWSAKRTARIASSLLTDAPAGVPFSGSVRDIYTRYGYLTGARITVTQHATGAAIVLITGPDGRFQAPGLQPGTYTVAVEMPGYGRLVADNFCVVAGKPARFDAALGPDRSGAPSMSPPQRDPGIVALPRSVPSSGAMTIAEIEAAMEFGRRSGQLEPISLTHRRGLNRHRTGLLFTPFLRVATLTQVAALAKKSFIASEIPAAFVQRLAWVVGLPETHFVYSSDMDSDAYLAGVSDIVIRPQGTTAAKSEIKPSWKMFLDTECDANALESVLGRHFSRPGIVAAFPMDAIVPGNTVVFTYSTHATPLDSFRGITVKREERRVVIDERHLQERR